MTEGRKTVQRLVKAISCQEGHMMIMEEERKYLAARRRRHAIRR